MNFEIMFFSAAITFAILHLFVISYFDRRRFNWEKKTMKAMDDALALCESLIDDQDKIRARLDKLEGKP
jgi:C4-dicarboxylate transporter